MKMKQATGGKSSGVREKVSDWSTSMEDILFVVNVLKWKKNPQIIKLVVYKICYFNQVCLLSFKLFRCTETNQVLDERFTSVRCV